MNQLVRKRRSDEDWFKKTATHLGHYRIWEARIKHLEMEKEILTPSCTPNYADDAVSGGTSSDQTGNIGIKRAEIEQEIKEKQIKLQQIDSALATLSEEQRAIIRLRYIDQLRDWQIYDLSKIPLGKTLYYTTRDEAMEILAKELGFLKC